MNSQKLPDLYEFLGVAPESTDDQIKKAYRKLAMKYHPDKNPGSDEKFKELNAVYEILSDPQKKKTYDLFRDSNMSMPEFAARSGQDYATLEKEIEGFMCGSVIGLLYSLIAISVNIIFGIPLTTAFFPSMVFFISPAIITKGSNFSKGFILGGATGVIMSPVFFAVQIFSYSKYLIEKPIKYILGRMDGNNSTNVGSAPTLLLDEEDWEFINKQKLEYEKIDEIERNWTFLHENQDKYNDKDFRNLSLYQSSLENIKITVKVIKEHYEKQDNSFESELILTKLLESLVFINDIELIFKNNSNNNNNNNNNTEGNSEDSGSTNKEISQSSISNDMESISKRIESVLNLVLGFITSEHSGYLVNMRILTLIKNMEIFLEEYVFNQFEYYQI
ncbi:hypothetical protein RB653_006531 [Dictyostelium firmibasis]|uniref:J domain-containing protein n=1 Tax=Dictyostelium firmibasis TaxID=79012 RepID=A0AAN7UMU0_9MYCE